MQKKIILLSLLVVLFLSGGKVSAQTVTPTPTQAAVISLTSTPTPTVSGSGTATPTSVSKLPETGAAQYTGVFILAALGIIILAFIF